MNLLSSAQSSHSKLTQRQQEILQLIQSHIASTGSPPTRAEIAKRMGFRSPNAAEDHLRALARKGVIELVAGTSRGIRLPHQPVALPLIAFNGLYEQAIAACLAQATDYYTLDPRLFQGPVHYLVRLNEMPPANLGLQLGDLLAIQESGSLGSKRSPQPHPEQIGLLRKSGRLSLALCSEGPSLEGRVLGFIRAQS